MTCNAWTELNVDTLRANLGQVKASLSPRAETILVVKSNAYGHGVRPVATCARAAGVRWFVVSRMDEAVELRGALADARILVLGAMWPSDVDAALEQGITPILMGEDQARALADGARQRHLALPCHVKIDTGMGRLGLPWEQAAGILVQLKAQGGLDIQGLCTHFASAGKPGDPFAALQGQRFGSVVTACKAQGLSIPFQHVANSAAFSARPEWDLDGVRVGILAYGYAGRLSAPRVRTRPFLQWKTRVIHVKRVPAGFPVSYLSTFVTATPTQLATIDVGYSDGFSRLMSNKGYVLIGGRRCRVVGRVTMNFTIVDVGPDAAVREGDEAVLIGQQGDETLWADELARWCQTIPYEILTNIRSTPRT